MLHLLSYDGHYQSSSNIYLKYLNSCLLIRKKISPVYLVLSSFKRLRTILNPGDNRPKTGKETRKLNRVHCSTVSRYSTDFIVTCIITRHILSVSHVERFLRNRTIRTCNQMVTSEIRQSFHARFVRILKAREIIRIWTKRKWNYFLISRVYHLITF